MFIIYVAFLAGVATIFVGTGKQRFLLENLSTPIDVDSAYHFISHIHEILFSEAIGVPISALTN